MLGVESEFIASSLPAADKRDAQQLRLRLDEVAKDSIEAKSALEIERVLEATDQLRAQFKALRRDVKQTDASIVFARIDGNYTSLEHASSLLEKVREDFEALESNEMDRMRQRFQHEVDEVARQRDLLSATLSEAEAVSIDLTRSGFGRLEDFFAESLLRADVGIIDVYWAQKVEVSEEKTRILEERKTLRDEIERRFALIEQKMRQ